MTQASASPSRFGGSLSTASLLTFHTRRLADTLEDIERSIADGAYMTEASMSAIYLTRVENRLREWADRIASQRLRLIEDQPQLPLLRAAE